MIKIIKTICVCCVICGLTSCGDFTELEPKGKNLLTTCDQLEILLNVNYSKASSDMRVVSGDIISGFKNIANTINQNNKSRDAIMWTWDEKNQDVMANLTASDADFQNMYGYIGTICNPILQRVDDATGSPSIKKQLKAEALALRAWSHYILVNKFAKSFNPSTAVSTPGIIVMTENVDITVPQKQKTVEEVYNQIMSDIDEALKLDALPKTAVNRMRMSLPAVYALKALVCLNMQQWDDAEKAAKQALAIDGSLADLNSEYLVLSGNNQVINKPRAQFIEDYFYK